MRFFFSFGFALLFWGIACKNPAPPERPNIIFIFADDHANKALSCYGSELIETPNLDRLASEGMRFDRAFCTNSICGPSRAVVLTGKYNHLNGQLDNNRPFDGSQLTFPKLLQQAGYQTALIGKWHLQTAPTGFDYWKVLLGQGHYYNPDFNEMGEIRRETGYVTNLITDYCLEWIEQRDKNRPFCLMYQHKAPHRNWMASPDHLDEIGTRDFPLPETFYDDYATRSAASREQEMRIDQHLTDEADLKLMPESGGDYDRHINFDRMNPEQREAWNTAYRESNAEFQTAGLSGQELAEWKYQRYIQDYLLAIASVDDNMGRLLDYLDETGLSENTVVIYTSDQGFYLGEHGWFDKRFMYEPSLRNPLLVRYPAEIGKGKSTEAMALNLDMAPTILDYAGVEIPEEMQGRSLRPVLKGATPADWRDAIYYHYYEYPAVHMVKRHYGVRTDRYKLIHFYYDIDAWELYDLQEDPNELNNLYEDPAYTDIVSGLKEKIQELQVQYADTAYSEWYYRSRDTIQHLALGKTLVLETPYAERYTGGGDQALTDGILWEGDNIFWRYNWDYWQGYHAEDLVATLDLGQIQDIHKVQLHCLQQYGSWIFFPQEVVYSFSPDGKNFAHALMAKSDRSPLEKGSFTHFFTVEPEGVQARYIKVEARNIRTVPQGHPGEGGKAWLFADELIVE